jgi:peroxiredoxin
MQKVFALVGQMAAPMVASLACLASTACGSTSTSAEGAASASSGTHPLVGQKAPDFVVNSMNSKERVALSKYSGKVAIVDFWATWCEPCKKSFPKLQELYVKYKASGLEMVAISEDDESNGIKDFAETYGAKFPVGWDDGKSIAGKWQIPNMPSTFIVDKSGIVRFVHLGYRDGEEQEIEKEVKSLL